MINAEKLRVNFINPRLMTILRIIFGAVIVYYLVERSIFSWNREIPALFFFTVQSNLMLALYWLFSPLLRGRNLRILSLIVTLNMVVTGVVFILILDGGFTDKLYLMLENHRISAMVHYIAMASSNITHYLMPLLALLDFLLFTDLRDYEITGLWKMLLYPWAYFIFHIVYYAVSGRIIYPFLDPGSVGGWGIVVLIAAGLTGAIILFARALMQLNRIVQRAMVGYFDRLIDD